MSRWLNLYQVEKGSGGWDTWTTPAGEPIGRVYRDRFWINLNEVRFGEALQADDDWSILRFEYVTENRPKPSYLELTTLSRIPHKDMPDQSVGFIGEGGNKIILEVEHIPVLQAIKHDVDLLMFAFDDTIWDAGGVTQIYLSPYMPIVPELQFRDSINVKDISR
tara:strand:+ start:624 stop:1115 length:492 start_codon:yes stop_codon:yes gene_type:complete